MISVDEARRVFGYDPDTGILRLKVAVGRRQAGDDAGGPKKTDYRQTYYSRRTYPTHRLIWLIVYGEWPEIIDHIDGNKANNRLANLRNVTETVNNQNLRRANSTNKLGILGVFELNGRFLASINIDGKKKHLGCFDTPEQAHAVYLEAKRKHHAGCTI